MRGAKQKKIFEISDLRREILHLRSVCLSVSPPPPQVRLSVCVLYIFMHMLARAIWGVQYFEFQYFWGFRKLNIFGGMKILWIFLGSSQNWTIRCI